MNTNDRRRDYKRKKKQIIRERQVRRQKIILVCLLLLVPLFIGTAVFFRHGEIGCKPLNSACRSYRSQVEEVAAEYDMQEYTDLLLALMMQESSGNGPDVMQSSEGAYNTRYPQKPNGIKDISYSIECGVQELKYALEKAEVKSPVDYDRIRLALQGYNFGADVYFSFLEENNIRTWSRETAEEFARIASGNKERSDQDPFKKPAGPWAYGDQRYPEHVLAYYHPPK